MGFPASVRRGFTGDSVNTIRTIPSAATLVLPTDENVFYISGTTAVTKISTGRRPGRRIRFIGTDATGNLFTNTNGTSTEGQMDFLGQSRTLVADDSFELQQQNDGSFILAGGPAVGVTLPTLTSASTLALTEGVDVYSLEGTATVTSITTTNIMAGREITFVGTSGVTTFTNNSGTTTSGQADLNGQNRTVGINRVLKLIQRSDGTFVMSGGTV